MFERPIRLFRNRLAAGAAAVVALVIGAVALPGDPPAPQRPESTAAPAVDASRPVGERVPEMEDEAASIHGEVLCGEGRPPAAGATVRLIALDGDLRDEVRTADGAFRFRSIPPGRYAVTAGSRGTGRAAWPMVELTPGATERVVLRLDVPARLAGRVLARDGSPRAGDRVSIRVDGPVATLLERMLGRPVDLGDRVVVTTDPAGRFRFDGLSPGRYDLSVERAGRRVRFVPNARAPNSSLEIRPIDESEPVVDDPVERPATDVDGDVPFIVTGSVVDADGGPVPGALVRLGRAVVAARVDGSFVLETTAPGHAWLETRAAGWAARVDGPYETAPRSRVTVPDVVLTRVGLEVRGRVETATGAPLAGARVEARFARPDEGTEVIAVESDAEGDYQVDGPDFEPHDVRVSVRAAGFRRAARVEHPDPLATASFRLVRSAEIAGVATFTGLVPDVLRAWVRDGDGAWREERCRWASDTGRFRLVGLAPGRRTFRLGAPGYASRSGPVVDLEPGALVRVPVPLRLSRGGTIVGRITDPAGEPLVGARVSTSTGAARRTDADGEFDLENVTPGRVTIYIHAGPRDVDSPSFEAEVREGETIRVDGRLPR